MQIGPLLAVTLVDVSGVMVEELEDGVELDVVNVQV